MQEILYALFKICSVEQAMAALWLGWQEEPMSEWQGCHIFSIHFQIGAKIKITTAPLMCISKCSASMSLH